MKHWKNLLVCLLAGVLALGVLTACSGLDLVYTVALDADSNMSHTDDLNAFLYWSGCYGVPKDVTVALLLDDSAAMTAQLYAPQADSAAAKLLEDAAGHSEMGAAFIDYNGTAYVVAVFR